MILKVRINFILFDPWDFLQKNFFHENKEKIIDQANEGRIKGVSRWELKYYPNMTLELDLDKMLSREQIQSSEIELKEVQVEGGIEDEVNKKSNNVNNEDNNSNINNNNIKNMSPEKQTLRDGQSQMIDQENIPTKVEQVQNAEE